MNKIFKITGWVLGLLGIVFGILAFVDEGSSVDLLLRCTYFPFFAAVVIWIGLAIFIAGRNNPKNLLKAAGVGRYRSLGCSGLRALSWSTGS